MGKIYNIIYKKEFNFKQQAEQFIESHKKQDCFYLEFNYSKINWIVTKLKLAV